MQIKEVIRKKRDGYAHSEEEIRAMVLGYLDDSIPDYQISAWLMALYVNGMHGLETRALTHVMAESGTCFPREIGEDFWIDKHSTGGIGDKTSLILVPLVTVVCEKLFGKGKVKIPMVSGRALGHTGGTLDK